jgi:sporulation protein YlmC with PRC-barrel domain
MAYTPSAIKAGVCHTNRYQPSSTPAVGEVIQPQRRHTMNTFVIRRRNAWKNSQELEATAGVSLRIGNEEMADQIRWIRSYVVHEEDGTLGTVCIYQAKSADAIREHARRVGMPAHEITRVEKTVIIRDDPSETDKAA